MLATILRENSDIAAISSGDNAFSISIILRIARSLITHLLFVVRIGTFDGNGAGLDLQKRHSSTRAITARAIHQLNWRSPRSIVAPCLKKDRRRGRAGESKPNPAFTPLTVLVCGPVSFSIRLHSTTPASARCCTLGLSDSRPMIPLGQPGGGASLATVQS